MKKLFGELNITWKKLIIFAIICGIYPAIMALLPITQDTSFRDIAISFEVWILFGIIIITNSNTAKESALKCFVFFLISQPLIYLVQVPFSHLGWQLFRYYKFWFIWTLLTIPMGYIGYYMRKEKWWSILILTPILVMLGYHYYGFLSETLSFFPNHLLSMLFCLVTLLLYPLVIFKNKKIKISSLVVSILIIILSTIIVITRGNTTYNTTILVSQGTTGIVFDDTYQVSLKDSSYGKVYIVYEKNIEDYMVNAEFKKTGTTEFTITSPEGQTNTFKLTIYRTSYDIEKISE